MPNRLNFTSWLIIACTLAFGLSPKHSSAQLNPRYDSVDIDSLDSDAWNGIVFLPRAFRQQAPFAIRIGSQSGDDFIDGKDVFHAVREVGPHAPDGSYSRVSWMHSSKNALITLEWSRIDETTVVGRITARSSFRFVLESYFPAYFSQNGRAVSWDLDHYVQGFYSIDDSHQAILGERYFDGVFGQAARFLVTVDRPTIGSGNYPALAQLRDNMNGSGRLNASTAPSPAATAGLEFNTQENTAHFVANLGWDKNILAEQAQSLLAAGKIDAILGEKAKAYAARRPSVKGLFEGAPEAIGNSMFWNTLYAPSLDSAFPSISRQWANGWGGWIVGEWDCFFGALLTSLEESKQTAAAIKAILLAQTENGLVPNAASASGITPGRSQPPVGSYITWKVYQRTQDRALLEWAYPRLKKWHEWWLRDRGDGQSWRDGNHDGLLEWGSDRGSAVGPGGRGYLMASRWETGIDDNPMYDEVKYDPKTYTMDLDDVGLNSLHVLDGECLANIATILGKEDDARIFTADYERQKQLIREKLWNEQDGIFENRFWSGEFSKHLSPTNFYPLLAGVPTPEQAKRMIDEHLLNPKEFWGTYVLPSISRNDPAFTDQFYVRGTIWGPLNYLVYEGINRYGFDRVALQYAQKSYDLYMDDWRKAQHDDEQYGASGGNGGGDPHYTWGALLPMLALEQYADVNPWEGLRFGALNPAAGGEFRGVTWGGHSYDVTIGPDKTALSRDGKLRFEGNAGVVVRNYQTEPGHLSFRVKSERPVQLLTRELESGNFNLKIDGKFVGSIPVRDGDGKLNVPAGEHRVELLK
ncbi:MAG TPA: trehalase family glycosidase [Terriglobales bacterium]|nr:trehalase family glycosidase [Terriglobales bacterium]